MKLQANSKASLSTNTLNAVNRFSNDFIVVLAPNDQLVNTSYRVAAHNFHIIC